MKHPHHTFDPAARVIPSDWIRRSSMERASDRRHPQGNEARKWMTTLPAPLATARDCTMQAFTGMSATLAYLYETDEKIVIRCTLQQRQIRAELKPLDDASTRIVVVTMAGSDVDRLTSGRIVDAIEHNLREAGYPPQA